jgi:hypothetical protein
VYGKIVMVDINFPFPVQVLVGLGFPVQIHSVLDAIQLMDAQPTQARDEAYHATYSACRDAFSGAIPTVEAYDVFCALMRRRGLLVEIWDQRHLAA